MTNFREFKLDLDKEIAGNIKQRDEFVKSVLITTYGSLIRNSPVHTGYYKANHFFDINKINFRTAPESEDYEAVAMENLNDAKELLKDIKMNKTKYITIHNSLPYAERLEDGHSSINKAMYAKARELAKDMFKKGY